MTDAYVHKAVEVALRELRIAFTEANLGRLERWDTYEDTQGTCLRLYFSSALHHGRPVRYARVVKPAEGPDKDPETAGMIYAAAFEERLRTRVPDPDPEGGYDTL